MPSSGCRRCRDYITITYPVMSTTMGEHFTRYEMTPIRRRLRRSMTTTETILWSRLRGSALARCKFRRQHSLEGFVLDFYSHECRLDIEVDGGYHNEPGQEEQDERRQRVLEEFGIETLRFTTDDVRFELETVIEKITTAVRRRRRQLSAERFKRKLELNRQGSV